MPTYAANITYVHLLYIYLEKISADMYKSMSEPGLF